MTTPRGEQIADAIADRIIGGSIAPGERLPSEARLADEFSASRAVVREAIQRLQTRGLVRTRTGSGSYALTPPADGGDGWLRASGSAERAELHAFRTAIEQEAAALAARHRTDDDLAALDAALASLASAALPAETLEADFALHRAIALASHNRYLAEMLTRLGATTIVLPHARLTDAVEAAVVAEHRHIVEAIRAGDAVAAAATMRAHLAASQSRIDPA